MKSSLLDEAYELCEEGKYALALEFYDLILFKEHHGSDKQGCYTTNTWKALQSNKML